MNVSELRESVDIELDQMERTLAKLERLLDAANVAVAEDTAIVAAAAYLANLYSGVEHTFKLIARERSVPLPTDPAWHRKLLDLFGSGHPPQLPELIDAELSDKMDRYLAFRHVFVHGYAIDLDWQRLEPAARSAAEVFGRFISRAREYLLTHDSPAKT